MKDEIHIRDCLKFINNNNYSWKNILFCIKINKMAHDLSSFNIGKNIKNQISNLVNGIMVDKKNIGIVLNNRE